MSITNYIALRYLKSNRENRFFSWITILSVSGLAIGVAALIVVLSVINGFEHELRKRFLHANAHIMAYRYPAGMSNPEKWADVIYKDFPKQVKGVSPFIHYETMAKNSSILRAVLVRGIAPKEREKVQSLEGLIRPFSALDVLQKEMDDRKAGKPKPEIPGIIVGSGLKRILGVEVGDKLKLITPTENRYSETKTFKIVGEYDSGLKHYDNRLVAMSLAAAKDFFGMGDLVTGLEIGLHDADQSGTIAERMDSKYNLSFREWQTYNRPLFEAMERERLVISLIVAMVVVVAGFNILTTIFVSVSQKQKDISILKSIGANNSQILKIFISQGVAIGCLGSVIGAVLALAISKFLETYQFIELPDPYFLQSLPVDYNYLTYVGVCLAAITICIVASLYPAVIASRVTPTEGFRGTGQAL
ncbi:FtsX-like permease family protein [Pseudobacteriovorax antillogorgiicola]|uniref:Lipoprotein-releasing system permease protein n=1 Tax=Pseudobacteriovorax antillogorgiicola TaxID=1513793 RepID=A0A1Y6CNN6_9BACT|nr:FtsX-like permease family protein [Pseudobacteriovorax antillogorgiicola]TCS44385.1 lipoprotein-releasing system permease protein [Pseudobacteriovorax antillogorgiicola]SMF79360.1 lipoprotein-releasing system permease protein [Pseudobacteriovorax antillogorgiicola]